MEMDWSKKSTWPKDKVDILIGSDLIYEKALVPLLATVVRDVLKPGGKFYYVAPEDGRDGLFEFIDQMKSICCDWKMIVAPPEYHANPLANGDEDQCFLHFQELSSLTYHLYEFKT